MTFSQRQGFKPISVVLQVGEMNDELRNSLWNVLDASIWSADGFLRDIYQRAGDIEIFSQLLWSHFFKKPADTRPSGNPPIFSGKQR